jgi:ferric enterobactin receptor
MKHRWHILLASILFVFWIPGTSAQSTAVITENFEGTPLAAALQLLENKYGIELAYESNAVAQTIIDQQLNASSLDQAFTQLLSDTHLSFMVVGQNKVMIRPDFSEPETALTPYQFTGRVTSSSDQSPLPYALLLSSDGNTGTYTDDNGQFVLPIDKDKLPLALKVHYLSYEEKTVYLDASQHNQKIHISLHPKSIAIEPVTVIELPPLLKSDADYSSLSIQAGLLDRLPGFAGGADVFRQLQLLPGVDATNDRSVGLNVRAGGEDENLIILDGITLFQADHFFGIFSALNTYAIDEIALYKNAFPAEYGGRTSSILEASGKAPLSQAFTGRIELNSLLLNGMLSIPLSPDMSLMLSGRVTNQDVTDSQLFGLIQHTETLLSRTINHEMPERNILSVEPDFRFYDTHMKWQWQATNKDAFQASYFKSFDDFSYEYEVAIPRNINGNIVNGKENYLEAADWENTGFSLQYARSWNEALKSTLQYSRSQLQSQRTLDAFYIGPFLQEKPILAVRTAQDNEIINHAVGLKNEWQYKQDASLVFGYHFERNDVNHQIAFARSPLLSSDERASIHALYAEHTNTWDNGFSITSGLRANYYQLKQQAYWSPRIQLHYPVNDYFKLKASLSRYHQFLRKFNFEDRLGRNFGFWVLGDEDIYPVAHANQLMLGTQFITSSGWSVDIEAYTRHREGVLTYALTSPGFRTEDEEVPMRYVLFSGTGRTIGIDFLIKRSWKNYASWLSYTISKSTNQFPEVNDGLSYPSQDDRRHQLKWVNTFEWKRWNFSASYIFASGKPYVDITRFGILDDRRDVDIDNFITYLDDYHRVDVGLSYQFSLFKKTAGIDASVFNIFDHDNIAYRQFIFAVPRNDGSTSNIPLGNDLQLLGRTFNVGVHFEF